MLLGEHKRSPALSQKRLAHKHMWAVFLRERGCELTCAGWYGGRGGGRRGLSP